MTPRIKLTVTALLSITWAAAAVLGSRALLNYENSPGKVGHIAADWPAKSSIQLATDRMTLVMLAHPQCPCTRASVNELAQIMARAQGKVRAYVLFYTPRGSGAQWENTQTRRSAAQIPGVTVLSDVDGAEAERFGAETSGHTFLFDQSGRLLFNGGITATRGHAGDNAGQDSIVSLIDNHDARLAQTFVFGCSLKNQAPGDRKCLK
jgi:hypothetical protein